MASAHATREGIREATPEQLEELREEFNFKPGSPGIIGKARRPLGDLATAPNVFQPRNFDEEPWRKERHVENLAKVVKDGRELDPILVYPVAGFLVVLDGHLRLEAYRMADLSSDDRIPVKLFDGTVLEARLRSLKENSKDKLSLTRAEKLEAAWRLMKDREGEGNPSYTDIQTATQVSRGTLSNMSKTLNEPDPTFDPRELSWKEVKQERRGNRDYDEDWMEALAGKWAREMRKALSDKPNNQPRIFWMAVEQAYPRLYEEHIAEIEELYDSF